MSALSPVLSNKEVQALEADLMGGDPKREWPVIQRAGAAIGQAILNDYNELRPLPRNPRALVLLGKGHNAADALAAVREILLARPRGEVLLLSLGDRNQFRPLTQKAAALLKELPSGTVQWLDTNDFQHNPEAALGAIGSVDFLIDGILGLSARLPLDKTLCDQIMVINYWDEAAMRVAIDIPTGLGAGEGVTEVLRADWTYAAGSIKDCLIDPRHLHHVGRVRFVDLDFPLNQYIPDGQAAPHWVTEEILTPLRKLRPANSDKRYYGHVFMVGGSRLYPGAILMSAKAAVRSGAGLVSVGAPESLVPSFASVLPEAIWIPLPESPDGGLTATAAERMKTLWARAEVLLIGPGMGSDENSLRCAEELARSFAGPLVLDADAVRPSVVKAAQQRPNAQSGLVITPHTGELLRLSEFDAETPIDLIDPRKLAAEIQGILLKKGSITQICDANRFYLSGWGGPVLARGGSGDILAGMIASVLAQGLKAGGSDLLELVARAQAWHGIAADALARANGQQAVQTTQILSYLNIALRE